MHSYLASWPSVPASTRSKAKLDITKVEDVAANMALVAKGQGRNRAAGLESCHRKAANSSTSLWSFHQGRVEGGQWWLKGWGLSDCQTFTLFSVDTDWLNCRLFQLYNFLQVVL